MIKRNKVNWKIPKGAELTELDKKVLYFQNKGHLVPTRELIKTPEQIEGIRRAGLLNTAVLDKVAENIKEGMSTAEIDKIVYDYTTSHGGIPACLGYEGFPKSVCTSINEVVCHGIPSEEEILEEGDIINVDCTTIVDGYYADASRMFIIGKNVWISVPRLPNLSDLWEISDMRSRNMPRKTAFRSCAIYAGTESDWNSMKNRTCCITDEKVQACCWCRGWSLPLSR